MLLPCGCDRDHSRRLDRAQNCLTSWQATLEMTAEHWADGRVPKTYVRQIGDAAEKSLQNEDEALAKIASDGRAGLLRKRIEDLRRRARELSQAAERSDVESAKRIMSSSTAQPTGTDAAGGRGT